MINLFKKTSTNEIIVNPDFASMASNENNRLSLHRFTAGEVLVLSEITKEGNIILKHHDRLYEDIQIVINKPKHEDYESYYTTSNGHLFSLYTKSSKTSYDFNFKSKPSIIRLICSSTILPTYRFDMFVDNCYDLHKLNDEVIKIIHGLNIKTGDRITIKCKSPGDGFVSVTTKFPFADDEESTVTFDVDNVKFDRYYLKDDSDDNVSNDKEE